MTTTISPAALSVITAYESLAIGNKTINCPYYNNKTQSLRGALRVLIGKGSPQEIIDEIQLLALKEHIDLNTLTQNKIEKFLIDHTIGIDCSGFTYYILDAHAREVAQTPLKKILSFHHKNILRRIIARIRPVENTDVKTFAHDSNSIDIPLTDIEPGDMIISLDGGVRHNYNHILIITSVTKNTHNIPTSCEYVHSFRWKSEGIYTHGIRRGEIQITDPSKDILDQTWTESDKEGKENETHTYLLTARKVSLKRIQRLIHTSHN